MCCLPAHAWGEKSGTVTNSERRISRQRSFMKPAGEAKSDWWIMSEVARRMGFGRAFAYRSAGDIFREHAALSTFENDGRRDFDLGWLSTLSDDNYETLPPVTWPVRSGEAAGAKRLFADGAFFTPDRKARFIATEAPALKSQTSTDLPLRLNTGRIRDQWHTMTRTGLSPRLGQHLPEPYVEIHPDDAQAFGIAADGYAQVSTSYGRCILKVMVSERQQRGQLFAPMHWNDETAFSARVGALVAPFTDPFSGQPELKATPAAVVPVELPQRGFVLAREPIQLPADVAWARIAVAGGIGYRVAAPAGVGPWQAWFDAARASGDLVEYSDPAHDGYRAAQFRGDTLQLCVFVGPAAGLSWDAITALFTADTIDAAQRRVLLSGKTTDGVAGEGPIVCACFGVGRNSIAAVLESGEACSAAEIGVKLRAGTNCGSCLPELKRIVAAHVAATPVQVAQELSPAK